MRHLTDEGRTVAAEVARRHDVATEAVVTLLLALERGGGVQAQFSHPDLGGMGQWSRHGMIMVGDMFNAALKARVDALCRELSTIYDTRTLFAPEHGSYSAAWSSSSTSNAWWPDGCGTPSSTGAANDTRYAFFPETRQLAILRHGTVELYDTGDHRISGVSSQQQNGSAADVMFTSQHGRVRLQELTRIGETPASTPPSAHAVAGGPPTRRARAAAQPVDASRSSPEPGAAETSGGATTDDEIFARIERLHALQQKGILSDAEFAEKKKELLARL